MTTISKIAIDSRDFAIKSGDMFEQAQSACPRDGSDIVLS